jgi:hypothetical protein
MGLVSFTSRVSFFGRRNRVAKMKLPMVAASRLTPKNRQTSRITGPASTMFALKALKGTPSGPGEVAGAIWMAF